MKKKLKPYDKVLVRNADKCHWQCELFSHNNNNKIFKYACTGGCYIYCIPYEGNEHLVGTTKSPDDNDETN